MQSFDHLNQFLPSSFILDKGLQFGTFSFCTSFLTSSSQRVFGLHLGLFEMGFHEGIALTILVSCILSIWPSHPKLYALMKFIMFLCFIILSSSWLVSIRQMPFSLVGPNIFLKTVYPIKWGYFQLVVRLHCLENLLEGLSRSALYAYDLPEWYILQATCANGVVATHYHIPFPAILKYFQFGVGRVFGRRPPCSAVKFWSGCQRNSCSYNP